MFRSFDHFHGNIPKWILLEEFVSILIVVPFFTWHTLRICTKVNSRWRCVVLGRSFYLIDIYLLTYYMVQSPSWEANRLAASKKIPRISRNPKVHYRTHKRPPPVSILGQPNPVYIPTFHILEIHPNIIHPSTPRSPHWSLSLRFPHQDPIHPLS